MAFIGDTRLLFLPSIAEARIRRDSADTRDADIGIAT